MLDLLDRQLHRSGLSPTSRKHYRYWLQRLADFCGKPVQEIEPEDIKAFLDAHRFSPRTRRIALLATNLLGPLQGRKLPVGILYPPPKRHAPHTPLSASELERLLQALEARERLFVELLLATGRPVGDLLALRCREARELQHSLSAGLRRRLQRWLEHSLDEDYVFPGRHGPVHIDTLRKRIHQAARAAGLRGINFHVLRATALVWTADIQSGKRCPHDA